MSDFEDKKLIGSGSFGNVYRVKKEGAFYALKEIPETPACIFVII